MKKWILETIFPEIVSYLRMRYSYGDTGAEALLEEYRLDKQEP